MLINVIGTVELITRQEHEVLCICEVAVVNLSFLLYFHSCLLCGRALHETPCFGSREIVMRSHSCTRICLYFFSLSLFLCLAVTCVSVQPDLATPQFKYCASLSQQHHRQPPRIFCKKCKFVNVLSATGWSAHHCSQNDASTTCADVCQPPVRNLLLANVVRAA